MSPTSTSPTGLSPQQLEETQRILTRHLQAIAPVTVFVFGSRARGDHRPYSDVDLLLESDSAIEPRVLRLIRSDLSDSSLPFKFDVVAREDLAASYRTPILTERRPWFTVRSCGP